MKTTHLLTTWALSALFVACTADEFKVANPDNVSQDRAKVHPDFVLLTEDLQTRYAVEGGAGISFDFEQGDRLGAALVDEYEEGENPEDFNVMSFVLENHCLDYQGNGQWTPDEQLSVGHYLYVYPYNPEDVGSRVENPEFVGLTYKFPAVQEMYADGSSLHRLNAAIEKGNQAISAGVLQEGDREADVELKNLFTYPKLTIYFDSAEPVSSVSQIILETEGTDPFVVKGEFDHRVVTDMFTQNHHGTLTGKDFWDETTQMVDWDKVGTYDFLYEGSASPYGEAEYSDQIVVKFADDAKVGEDYVTKNKFVEARIMMPSIDNFGPELDDPSASTGIMMYIYTDNGIYRTPFQASSFDFKATTDKEKQQAALWRNRSNGLTLKPLTADNKTKDTRLYITSQADWNRLVDLYGNSGIDQYITCVDDEFVFDETTKWPTNCRFYLTTNASVEGNVEIKNVTVQGWDLTIKEGATLTATNAMSAWHVYNYGNLIVKISDETEEGAYHGLLRDIQNFATMSVEEGAKILLYMIWNESGAVINNAGDIITGIYNKGGAIFNYGIIRDGITNVNADGYAAMIINAKGALIEGVVYNSATLTNEGTLTCDNEQYGTLYSEIGATTNVIDNYGAIVVKTADAAGLTIEGEKGSVMYNATQAEEDFTNSLVNRVNFSGDYTLLGGEIDYLTFWPSDETEATLTVNNGSKVGYLEVNSGKLELASDIDIEMLVVQLRGVFVIPAGVTLNFNGFAENFYNHGRIIVRGTLIAPNIMEGDYIGEGTIDVEGGEVIWGNQSEESAE